MAAGGPRRRDLPLVDVVRLQALACEQAGSRLYARILGCVQDDVAAEGVCEHLMAPFAANAMADAIPLRLLAGVHELVLSGEIPELAELYPSAGGTAEVDDAELARRFLGAVERWRPRLEAAMHLGVQTNEVGRAAALVGGFHRVAERTGLPLRVREVGASAGLLLRWDRYRYETATWSWGPPGALTFREPFVGGAPRFVDAQVADRRGCDIAPIDLGRARGVTRLRSFLWPDQVERRARLDQAIEVAAQLPVVIDRADAGDWVAEQLAAPTPGLATVVHHSIVLQYLPRASFDRMRSAIEDAGARATADAPVFWLRMEPAGEVADVRLRSWPGDDDELLATTGYHGPPVNWCADASSTA